MAENIFMNNGKYMKKERDFAIDIVKFIAVLLIIYSHADIMYPRMQILATGGAIGDCLFLFCSGFTLFLGGKNHLTVISKDGLIGFFPLY